MYISLVPYDIIDKMLGSSWDSDYQNELLGSVFGARLSLEEASGSSLVGFYSKLLEYNISASLLVLATRQHLVIRTKAFRD